MKYVAGNTNGTFPEPVPIRDFTPSTALSKAIVDFSIAVIAFLYALSLGAPDAVNPSNILFFVAMFA